MHTVLIKVQGLVRWVGGDTGEGGSGRLQIFREKAATAPHVSLC